VSLGAAAKASALKRENGGILPNVKSSIKRKGSVTEGKNQQQQNPLKREQRTLMLFFNSSIYQY
jgi:hypothetical protein